MTPEFLPYGRQDITDADVDAVAGALRQQLITQGPTIEAFEEAFAKYVGAKHAIAYSSGTAALHGAAHAAGLGPGSEALVPPITFAASSNCALYTGATTRLIDIDAATWNLDTVAAAAAVTGETKAVIPVSFAGLPVDLSPLDPVRGQVTVIEDACHALGGKRSGGMVGGPGGADITCFSLHPVKAMTTGEGGMATTEEEELAASLRSFRTHGIVRAGLDVEALGPWYYEMTDLGFNYRITDFQCALGLSQLERLDGWIARRNEIAARYRELLEGEERLELTPAAPRGDLHGHHLFPVRVKAGAEARRFVFDSLRAAGIGTQVHYIPVYKLQYYRETLGYPQDECPNAETYYSGALSLPMFPGMVDGDTERVAGELRSALDGAPA